jgi:hypothetical protein
MVKQNGFRSGRGILGTRLGRKKSHSLPPISQMTRNGWGTGNLLCPTHFANDAKWMGHGGEMDGARRRNR